MAVLTPQFSGETFWSYAPIGTYVGVIPVALGLLWYPFLRRLGSAGMNFVLAMTVGLLAFLVIDTLEEARWRSPRSYLGILGRPACGTSDLAHAARARGDGTAAQGGVARRRAGSAPLTG